MGLGLSPSTNSNGGLKVPQWVVQSTLPLLIGGLITLVVQTNAGINHASERIAAIEAKIDVKFNSLEQRLQRTETYIDQLRVRP